MNLALEVRGLEKRFQGKIIFSNLCLALEKGSVTVLYGPSGVGKTTLIKCLLLLEKPEKGTVSVHGERVFEDGKVIYEDGIRKTVGVVFQDFYLWDNKTALENITEALVYVKKMPKSFAINLAKEKAKDVSLPVEFLQRYPSELSRGQRQRVAIARMLAMDPDIILLDEPTASLDAELVHRVVEIVKMLQAAQKTILIVSHDMDFAKRVTKNILDFNGLSSRDSSLFISSPTSTPNQTKSPPIE